MEYIKHMVRLELYAIFAENASPFSKNFRHDSTKYDIFLVFLLFIWYHMDAQPLFPSDSGTVPGKI